MLICKTSNTFLHHLKINFNIEWISNQNSSIFTNFVNDVYHFFWKVCQNIQHLLEDGRNFDKYHKIENSAFRNVFRKCSNNDYSRKLSNIERHLFYLNSLHDKISILSKKCKPLSLILKSFPEHLPLFQTWRWKKFRKKNKISAVFNIKMQA